MFENLVILKGSLLQYTTAWTRLKVTETVSFLHMDIFYTYGYL